MESPKTVIITIRAPNHQQEDQDVISQLDWTIEELKQHLQEAYPGQPPASNQKLIYAGHMLRDHLRLRDMIVGEGRHVLHLVLTSDVSTPSDPLRVGRDKSAPVQATAMPDPLTVSLNYWVNWIQWYTTWDTYGVSLDQWQEMYNAHTHVHPSRVESPPPPPPVVPPPAEPAGARQGNEEGGGVFLFDDEDEEGAARDWLDWLYLGSRLLVLLAVVYFYSTPGRFLFVVAVCFAFYMYQRGLFTLQRRHGAPQQEAAEPVQEEEIVPEPVRPRAAGVNPLNVLVSFFSSLIPERPAAPVNLN